MNTTPGKTTPSHTKPSKNPSGPSPSEGLAPPAPRLAPRPSGSISRDRASNVFRNSVEIRRALSFSALAMARAGGRMEMGTGRAGTNAATGGDFGRLSAGGSTSEPSFFTILRTHWSRGSEPSTPLHTSASCRPANGQATIRQRAVRPHRPPKCLQRVPQELHAPPTKRNEQPSSSYGGYREKRRASLTEQSASDLPSVSYNGDSYKRFQLRSPSPDRVHKDFGTAIIAVYGHTGRRREEILRYRYVLLDEFKLHSVHELYPWACSFYAILSNGNASFP
ncbi:hypothetical protein QBC46DRAFT_423686 [Diplogelasinospora grovesii]|uniref:Uncharacterized protein n=1 Tax=Diplogelasinospora grovesii TaxID=303347 RepID=A0AAN6S719_9PEZI|nr:hypothetical protein QBC46DRAFT_423686 [Diplogelasinospora grovesii]